MILFLVLLLLSSCGNTPPPLKSINTSSETPLSPSIEQSTTPTTFSGVIMTVPYRILVGNYLSVEKRNRIEEVIMSTFHEVDTIYNKWNPNSEVSKLNALDANTPCPLSSKMFKFLERITPLIHLSEGRFDPTIEPMARLWKSYLNQGSVPSTEEINTLRQAIGWHNINFENGVFIKMDHRTELDFGGVAKGYCVDLLIENISNEGIKNIYVDWGGEIRTLGIHPSNRPWHISIGFPSGEKMQSLTHFDLVDSALATSGDYFQYWKIKNREGEEKIYCHIFNPLTYTPLEVKQDSVATASFLAADCLTADAMAKVLMLFPSIEEAKSWVLKLQSTNPTIQCWIAQRN